jgi:phenylacetate-CoA ligase
MMGQHLLASKDALRKMNRPLYDVSVIAPCYNEMENAIALVERLQLVFEKHDLNGQVVLVNDASKDQTGKIIDELATKYDNVVAVHHSVNQGIAGGWQSGLDNSMGKYVCLIDADLQYLPEEVWRLFREIEASRVDMVQGFRSTIERLKDSRYLFSKTLNIMLNACFGMSLRDNKSGFVIARRDTLADILKHRFHYYYFNTFIAIAAKAKGYSIREVETLFKNRNLGQSYIQGFPLKLVAKVLVDIVVAFFEYNIFNTPRKDDIEAFIERNPVSHPVERNQGWRRLLFEFYFATMPLHKWKITGSAKQYYHLLKKSEWLPPRKLQDLQEIRLRHLIRHVYHHVPYYSNLMQSLSLMPEDIKNIADLQKLPLLSKQAIRENLYFDLFADNHKKDEMLKIATSGSTGEPLVTYADRHQLEMRWANTLRSTEWTGWRFGDRQARLWHQTIGMTPLQVFKEYLDALLMRRMFIPAFEMSEETLAAMFNRLKRFKPVLIDGYAESFNFLAQYAQRHGVDGFSPKAIISSAQIMPPQVCKVIEQAFDTSVYDKYGSREFSGIAYECEQHQGHHIMAESYIVEILKDGRPAKPGELGEVVITDLNNFSVPLLRYRIGDLAMAMDPEQVCPCGRGLPRLGQIEGRAQALVFCANGTWLPGGFFGHFFKDYDYAVRQYQVIQERQSAIHLKVVPGNQFSNELMENILKSLREYMGETMEINVSLVDEIPLLKTGKRTGVISHLQYDFQNMAKSKED